MTAGPAGVIAPLVTPMALDGTVSRQGVRSQIEAIRTWVSGLMPCISSGEGWRLTPSQWRSMTGEAIESSGGLPVYAGCQAMDWAELERRVSWAEEMTAQAVVVSIPPRHGTCSDDELVARLKHVRSLTPIPIVYYWESFVSGRVVGPDLGIRICRELDAVAVKDSMRSTTLTQTLLAHLGGRVSVLQGWEDQLSPSLAVDGYVGPLALLSSTPGTAFSDDPQWAEIGLESERFGILDRDYIARVKAELRERGVIPSAAEFPGVPDVSWDR